MREIEEILNNNYDNDYNKILSIYPEMDSTTAAGYQEQIDDCIKKASIAIQRHKNSKWVDDSYIYVGMARHRSLDFVNAIDTYKFVNTNSEDDNARHEALARLLRTFVDYEEFNNALAVEDFLKKEKSINKANRKLISLNKAHHYQTVEDIDKMVQNLVDAAPLLKKSDGKGRIYFIIGQTYQKLGFDAEAFNYYRKCLASNPEYELDFYARLNMAQVTKLGKSSDIKSARKLLNALLKDAKNEEFRDKIYYELGQFELKQGNREEAIGHYKSSVRSSISNTRQKGQSFLKLGEIYYDTLSNYELAQAYYDSAVQSLPADYDNIEKIKKRAAVLKDFVKQLNTIQVQDSLLMLAGLDSVVLVQRLTRMIKEETARKKELEEKAQREARRQQFRSTLNDNEGIQSTSWYFGNPSAVAQGQSEFTRIWGVRTLEDNWRRLSRVISENDIEESNETDNTVAISDDTPVDQTTNAVDDITQQLASMYSQIPFSEEAKQKANTKIEEAYYALANIYKYQLEEDENAINAFETLIMRFPESEYHPEALYQLYLIYKGLEDHYWHTVKDELISRFPKSIYAKLIVNPNYREESKAANEKLKSIYEIAYNFFISSSYDSAIRVIDDALHQYEDAPFVANMKLLKILITGKTEDISLYQYELGKFVKEYPDAEIKTYAEKLLAASESFQKRKRERLGAQYIKYFDQSHYFIYIYQTKSGIGDIVSKAIADFDDDNGYSTLRSSNLILNDELAMILISDFKGKEEAIEYFELFINADPVDEQIRNSKFHKFVITKDNFNIFYQSKELDTYLRFFEKNYLNGNN